MDNRFDYFVVFAEMRTGSNFLESNINALDGVTCHGEAFNPHFIGYPNRDDILGVTQSQRDEDPMHVIRAMKGSDEFSGFRYFHDHDARVLDAMLEGPRCAKIVLTRNPAESYVSWKIAQATGQWKLTNVKARKTAKAEFDAVEFARHVESLQAFQLLLMNRLQTTGQTAFYVDYEDLQSVDVMNGLAAFLGVPARLEALDKTLKVQNPAALSDKVANFEEMERALAGIDRFNMTRTPNFEPRRAAAVPTYVAAPQTSLIYLPIKGGPVEEVENWMAALDGVPREDLLRNMNQKDLRQWKRARAGHRSFTVVRHPVARAHHVFCKYILGTGPGSYGQIRRTLNKQHKVAVPLDGPGTDWTAEQHQTAFAGFLTFLKQNLTGQTSVRVDAAWCTQAHAVQGFGEFMLPDFLVREGDLTHELPHIAAQVSEGIPSAPNEALADTPFDLADIYDRDIEKLTRAAYQRDYMMFGFNDWSAT